MRQIIAVALTVSLGGLLIPAPVSAVALQVTDQKLSGLRIDAWSWLQSLIGSLSRGANQGNRELKGVRPGPAPTKEEREARVAALEINPANEVTLPSRQPLMFTAIPLDQAGNAIHGLRPVWRSSDRQVIFIKHNGEAVAGMPGQAKVMARIGSKVAEVRVTVVEGSKEPFGGKKRVDSTRTPQALVAQKVTSKRKRAHAVSKLTRVMPFIRDPNDDPLPDNETTSLYQPNNLIGAPPGKKKTGALTAASAVPVTESGNKNFNFNLPVVNLPGRGVDVSLALIYNSLLWNKSTNPSDSSTWMTYDVDSGYPAQGFRLGFGQIEDQGSAGFTLTDADGTRHALVYSSQYNYNTTDGTFLHFIGGSGWGTLYYPDGTMVGYGAAGGGYRSYPTSIYDRNGNYLLISYVNGVGPRIYSITDTLGRLVRFYYDSNNDLVAITTPGLTGQSDLQVMRFYYENVSLPSGLFASGINVDKPASARVIRYIYLPSSAEGSSSSSGDIGYRFDYSPYGMVYQIVRFHGITASTTSTSSTGTVTEGSNTTAATTTYGYPTTASSLSDLPTFGTRTDEWAGRTGGGSAPQYQFSVSEGSSETTTTVTAPNGTASVSVSVKNPGVWNDGFVSETRVQNSSSVVFAKTVIGWEQNSTKGNGAVHSIAYNNALQVSQVKLKQSSSGSELQRYDYLYGEVTQSSGSVDKSKNNGQIGRVDGIINGSSTKEWDQRFSYDELGRISTATEYQQGTGSTPTWKQEFTYDRYGNRFQSGSNNFGVPFTPVVSSDITAGTNRFITSGSTPVTYDNSGNITQDAKFRFMNYTYDANSRQTATAATNSDFAQTAVYDCAGQRVQTTTNSVTRTMVYDIFGQLVADYNGTTMERENIYRGGQVLAIYEAASTCYMTIADFVTSFYQGALNRDPTSTELSEWTGKLSQAQAEGYGRLIKMAQDLGAAIFTSTEYTNLGTSNEDYVTDLYAAFLQRAPDSGGFYDWINALNAGYSRTHVRNGFAYSLEFQGNVMRLCPTTSSGTSSSANLKYVLSDVQGSARALMDNSGSGTSVIVARYDYLPFGEQIWAGVGLRTTTLKYAATAKVRQRFALLERDEGTGLDHTMFRKYDSFAGRWLTPDPYRGSARLRNPQSFNRYVYVENDPVNFIDPLGLCVFNVNISGVSGQELTDLQNEMSRIFQSGGHSVVFGEPGRANGGSLNLQVVGIYEGAAASHIRSQRSSIANPAHPGVFPPGGNTGYVNSTHVSLATPWGTNLVSQGTAMGRIGAHELIQHGFLGIPPESRGRDIRDAYVSRHQVFSPTTNRFNMSPITSALLAGLCPPAPPAPAAPNVPDGGGGGGGGGGGDFGGGAGGGGGGMPSWWWALQDFLAWINSIQIGRVTLTVIDDVDPPEDEAL